MDSTPVNIVDLSSTGLRFEHGHRDGADLSDYKLDDLISVEFHLSDRTLTHIQETAFIKNINTQYIGAEFEAPKQSDPVIGAYILSRRFNQMVV